MSTRLLKFMGATYRKVWANEEKPKLAYWDPHLYVKETEDGTILMRLGPSSRTVAVDGKTFRESVDYALQLIRDLGLFRPDPMETPKQNDLPKLYFGDVANLKRIVFVR